MEIDQEDSNNVAQVSNKSSAKEILRNKMLDHLCRSQEAHFKSQQIGDPDLTDCEKRIIAEQILDHNIVTFLSRFGNYLLEDHLEYFNDCPEELRYEIDFYLKRVRATHNTTSSKVKVRNRRFEALKKLVSDGSYFSEYEMKKRNPLLYEQLIGQFLTEEEEKERTGIDTTNITFVNLLLEQYDRDQMKKLKKCQEEDEDNQKEEKDDEESEEDEDSNQMKVESNNLDSDTEDNDQQYVVSSLWGEKMTDAKDAINSFPSSSKELIKKSKSTNKEILSIRKMDLEDEEQEVEEEDELSDDEKNLLMEEFRSSMFNSFLEGKDSDFNYNEVDQNSDYDDIDMRDLDEQEQYFDSESPELLCSVNGSADNSNQGLITEPISSNTDSVNNKNIVLNSDNFTDDQKVNGDLTDLQSSSTDNITEDMKRLHH